MYVTIVTGPEVRNNGSVEFSIVKMQPPQAGVDRNQNWKWKFPENIVYEVRPHQPHTPPLPPHTPYKAIIINLLPWEDSGEWIKGVLQNWFQCNLQLLLVAVNASVPSYMIPLGLLWYICNIILQFSPTEGLRYHSITLLWKLPASVRWFLHLL